MTNRMISISPSSTSLILVATFHYHLHMMFISLWADLIFMSLLCIRSVLKIEAGYWQISWYMLQGFLKFCLKWAYCQFAVGFLFVVVFFFFANYSCLKIYFASTTFYHVKCVMYGQSDINRWAVLDTLIWLQITPFTWFRNRIYGRCDWSTGDVYSS
jgi:hypothetical protein